MNPLNIKATHITPEVIMDKEKGIFSLTGHSRPEDSVNFYQPILAWVKEYALNPNPTTLLVLSLDYFNTSSSKMVYTLINTLKEPFIKGSDIKIEWRYPSDDDDMLEMGQDYASIVPIPFTYVPLK